jgi:outer membrane immunogenic protein
MKMRIAIAGLAATLLSLGAASAADLTPAPYVKAPPPLPMYNWTNWYIGLNVGGSWGKQDTSLTGFGTNSLSLDGVIGGGQIGYNWQGLGSPWVFGIEADIQGSDEHNNNGAFAAAASACPVVVIAPINCTPASAIGYSDKLEWFGTLRGRVGWATGYEGRWLPYVTGGLAYGRATINGGGVIGTPGPAPGVSTAVAFSSNATQVGWTVGAGLEWAFGGEWSAKIEYLYMDLGDSQTIALIPGVNLTSNHVTDNIGRVGINWHF